jgi:ATP-dependent protease ClpP protease subunit
MPYPNEHSCRLKDPGAFQEGSFRRVTREHEGKRYGVIMGRLKGETTMSEQAYRYPKDDWSAAAARSHCKSHEGRFEKAGEAAAAVVPCGCASRDEAAAPASIAELLEAAGRLDRGPAPRPAAEAPRVALRAEADGESADLYLYDSIGGWFGLNAAQVIAELRQLQAARLRVHINSPGGDVFDGLAIYNTLKSWDGEVETLVEGLAASIAGVIALAGRTVTMAPASFFMIHEPHGLAIGGAARMRHLADLLDQTGGLLADIYAAKTGAPRADVRGWMGAETWYTAAEAAAAGFADALLEADPAPEPARAAASFDLSLFQHVPVALARPAASRPTPMPARARERAATLARSFRYLVGV